MPKKRKPWNPKVICVHPPESERDPLALDKYYGLLAEIFLRQEANAAAKANEKAS